MELRFKHCLEEDKVLALETEIASLGGAVARSRSDRQHLEKYGTLPPPSSSSPPAAAAPVT